MPTLDWLRREFHYGYDSGDILSFIPNTTRFKEERAIGGSYRKVFSKAVIPFIKEDSTVLELGPGRGSWTRAILQYVTKGRIHTVDFQDVTKWLHPEKYNGRLICHKADDNSYYDNFENDYFDFFWSFGVLCHNNLGQIEEILKNSLPKMKHGGIAVHQYADWEKLEQYGWDRKSRVPSEFRNMPDDKIWWPRNDLKTMSSVAERSGWIVKEGDMGVVKRDSIILLQRV